MKTKHTSSIVTLIACFVLCCTVPASAGLNSQLYVSGADGESTMVGYKNWIDSSSFSHGIKRDDGAITFTDLTVGKETDLATAILNMKLCQNAVIPAVQLDVVATGPSPQVIYSIILQNASITSTSISGTDAADVPSEEITFSFETITWVYNQYDNMGARLRTVSNSWNVASP